MKTLMVVLLFLLTTSTFAKGGKEGGNGGNEYGLQFQALIEVAMKNIEMKDPAMYVKIYRNVEGSLTKKVKVLIVDEELEVSSNGVTQKSVAKNFVEENLILINDIRWNTIPAQQIREAVALHEILSLTGLEETGVYTYSAKYLAMFDMAISSFNNILLIPSGQKQTERDDLNDLVDLANHAIARSDFDEALEKLEIVSNKTAKSCKQNRSSYDCQLNKNVLKKIGDIQDNYFYKTGKELQRQNEECPNAFARILHPACSGLFR